MQLSEYLDLRQQELLAAQTAQAPQGGNPFDIFDQQQAPQPPAGGNPFDVFDAAQPEPARYGDQFGIPNVADTSTLPMDALAVAGHGWQPDDNQSNRGTIYSRSWSGENAPVVTPNMTIPLVVQRDPDQGASVDEDIPFGLAVTISMPGEVAIYEEVRSRLAPLIRAPKI